MRHTRVLLPLLLVAVFTSSCTAGVGDTASTSVSVLKTKLDAGSPVVLDCRTPEELTGPLGALDGVINIPVQQLDTRMKELQKHKKDTIYVICRSGNRSKTATAMLNAKGFTAVNIEGGMIAWRKQYEAASR